MRLLLLLGLVAGYSSAQQSKGPCHIQSNGLACTRNGNFEMTQCNSKDCFCVAANTGFPAEETKTGNSRKVPTCSKCHLMLREIFTSTLNLSPNAYVPTCDTKKGDFTEIQCHAFKKECWCVNAKTGEEISGTRQVHSNNQLIKCQKQTGGVDGRFPTALSGKKIEYPVANSSCKLSVNRGTACSGKKPKVMYYFDSNQADCFAFEYLGCGGNENKYESKRDCHKGCNLADMFSCQGLVEPKGTCNPGMSMLPPPPPPALHSNATTAKPTTTTTEAPMCPTGYRCQMGAFFGFCCPIEVEEFYNKEYSPSCPNGGKPHQDNTGDWNETRLGTSCSHNFCPTGKKCHQGKLFAYCC